MSPVVKVILFGLPLVILIVLSLLILHSVAPDIGRTQVTYVAVGLVLMLIISRFDYHLLLFSPWPWYALILIMLGLTAVFADPIRGSSRWITLGGFQFQTSEFVKPLFLIFLSTWLSQSPPLSFKDVLKMLAVGLVPAVMVFLEPDLGSAIILVVMLGALVVAAGAPWKYILTLAISIVLIIPVGYHFLRPYQRDRLNTFVNPGQDPLGTGYHATQATIAVGSGQIFGRGLGQGTQSHLRFLPERHTDFIFASLVEELGLFGGSLVVVSYIWLCVLLLSLARETGNDAGSLLILGSVTIFLIQALVNMGMNMGIVPITGITLPLVSAGGSSLLSFMIILGLCFSVSRVSSTHKASLEIH